ncbi:hypothetical protein GCM10010252_58730 [Streptomyces aureoverticillatus]|nr:hypothetical protein GCM10010252_58730 [Streptomyces aureoverticillatus]
MSHRARHARRPQGSTSLRATVVATAVAGGVLAAPAATAFANDATPKPTPSVSKPSEEDVKKKRAAAEEAMRDGKPTTAPRGAVAAGDKPVARNAPKEAMKDGKPTTAPRGAVAAGDKPVVRKDETKPAPKPLSPEERKKAAADQAKRAPEGGVAAGERPASGGDNTGTLVGSAAGIALLAGASTMVLRRRAAGRPQG